MNNKIGNKQRVKELTDMKAKLLYELGQEVYAAYRRGDTVTAVLEEKSDLIKGVDSKIHERLKEIEADLDELTECSCGAQLSSDDMFCQQCGKKADVTAETHTRTMSCYRCENEVPAEANYCNVCGVKM